MKIDGKRVILKPFSAEDIPHRVKWMNDKELMKLVNVPSPVTRLSTAVWQKELEHSSDRADFSIILKESNKLIGYVGFRNVNREDSNAELYIGIGEKQYWGRLIARESMILAIRYMIDHYSIQKFYAYLREENRRIIHLYEQFGSTIEATFREEIYSDGSFHNFVLISIFKDEFESLYGNREKQSSKFLL